jgi:hypothetical protein
MGPPGSRWREPTGSTRAGSGRCAGRRREEPTAPDLAVPDDLETAGTGGSRPCRAARPFAACPAGRWPGRGHEPACRGHARPVRPLRRDTGWIGGAGTGQRPRKRGMMPARGAIMSGSGDPSGLGGRHLSGRGVQGRGKLAAGIVMQFLGKGRQAPPARPRGHRGSNPFVRPARTGAGQEIQAASCPEDARCPVGCFAFKGPLRQRGCRGDPVSGRGAGADRATRGSGTSVGAAIFPQSDRTSLSRNSTTRFPQGSRRLKLQTKNGPRHGRLTLDLGPPRP